ncbi:MAG TPA: hypothetical protein PKA37_16355 [Planctomycetota bacterium]|nr:hypothetical protein [Planctomycetota bacterium]
MESKKEVREPVRTRTGEMKHRLLMLASSLSGEELEAFLQLEGLHGDDIKEWRAKVIAGLERSGKETVANGEVKLQRALDKDLLRQDRALTEATALLALKSKIEEIWGDGNN